MPYHEISEGPKWANRCQTIAKSQFLVCFRHKSSSIVSQATDHRPHAVGFLYGLTLLTLIKILSTLRQLVTKQYDVSNSVIYLDNCIHFLCSNVLPERRALPKLWCISETMYCFFFSKLLQKLCWPAFSPLCLCVCVCTSRTCLHMLMQVLAYSEALSMYNMLKHCAVFYHTWSMSFKKLRKRSLCLVLLLYCTISRHSWHVKYNRDLKLNCCSVASSVLCR